MITVFADVTTRVFIKRKTCIAQNMGNSSAVYLFYNVLMWDLGAFPSPKEGFLYARPRFDSEVHAGDGGIACYYDHCVCENVKMNLATM
jgi:hypothetical protein